MLLSELYSRITSTVIRSANIAPFVPFVGNIEDGVDNWVRDNPEQARIMAAEVYRLLRQYYDQRQN